MAKKCRHKKLTQAKAKKIKRHGEVHGKPLTTQQEKFFGAIAGGQKPRPKKSGRKKRKWPP